MVRVRIGMLVALGVLQASLAGGQGVANTYKPAIAKGLAWLAKQQKADGSWPVGANESPVTAASFAGLAMLAEGSTSTKGAYKEHVAKTVDWFTQNCQTGDRDGLLVSKTEQMRGRYMIPQSHAVLFLASAYEMEPKDEGGKSIEDRFNRLRRKEVKATLERAVAFVVKAQARSGGWFSTSVVEGHDFDLGLETAWQIQALRAAQQAGIDVPKETLQRGLAYLEKNTSPQGGVNYSSGPRSSERPDVTVAALACAFPAGEYGAEAPRKWLKRFASNPADGTTFGLLHGAQVIHGLGDDGYAKLFGQDTLKWSSYKERYCDQLIGGARPSPKLPAQKNDGSWPARGDGHEAVCATAVSLIILQLDNEAVPIFRAKRGGAKK